jgi:hypothetical protein
MPAGPCKATRHANWHGEGWSARAVCVNACQRGNVPSRNASPSVGTGRGPRGRLSRAKSNHGAPVYWRFLKSISATPAPLMRRGDGTQSVSARSSSRRRAAPRDARLTWVLPKRDEAAGGTVGLVYGGDFGPVGGAGALRAATIAGSVNRYLRVRSAKFVNASSSSRNGGPHDRRFRKGSRQCHAAPRPPADLPQALLHDDPDSGRHQLDRQAATAITR